MALLNVPVMEDNELLLSWLIRTAELNAIGPDLFLSTCLTNKSDKKLSLHILWKTRYVSFEPIQQLFNLPPGKINWSRVLLQHTPYGIESIFIDELERINIVHTTLNPKDPLISSKTKKYSATSLKICPHCQEELKIQKKRALLLTEHQILNVFCCAKHHTCLNNWSIPGTTGSLKFEQRPSSSSNPCEIWNSLSEEERETEIKYAQFIQKLTKLHPNLKLQDIVDLIHQRFYEVTNSFNKQEQLKEFADYLTHNGYMSLLERLNSSRPLNLVKHLQERELHLPALTAGYLFALYETNFPLLEKRIKHIPTGKNTFNSKIKQLNIHSDDPYNQSCMKFIFPDQTVFYSTPHAVLGGWRPPSKRPGDPQQYLQSIVCTSENLDPEDVSIKEGDHPNNAVIEFKNLDTTVKFSNWAVKTKQNIWLPDVRHLSLEEINDYISIHHISSSSEEMKSLFRLLPPHHKKKFIYHPTQRQNLSKQYSYLHTIEHEDCCKFYCKKSFKNFFADPHCPKCSFKESDLDIVENRKVILDGYLDRERRYTLISPFDPIKPIQLQCYICNTIVTGTVSEFLKGNKTCACQLKKPIKAKKQNKKK